MTTTVASRRSAEGGSTRGRVWSRGTSARSTPQTIRGQVEVEVSATCTEPMPQCVGKIYKYSPHVEVQFVLAKSPALHARSAARKARRPHLSPRTTRTGNHHCVLVLDRTDVVKSVLPELLPEHGHDRVAPRREEKQVLVIGGDSDDGIKQGRASISAAVFQGDAESATRSYRSTDVLNKKAALVSAGRTDPRPPSAGSDRRPQTGRRPDRHGDRPQPTSGPRPQRADPGRGGRLRAGPNS